jgi:hypothetical protein
MKKLLLGLALCLPQMASAQGDAGTISVCLSRYTRPHARYMATVNWRTPGTYRHLVLGALDQSHAVWVQRTYETPSGRGVDVLRFTVSDVSSYPLTFAMYDLDDAAYASYRTACERFQECYFGPEDPGVRRLTGTDVANSAAAMQEQRPCSDASPRRPETRGN